jgi:hypothetical protein
VSRRHFDALVAWGTLPGPYYLADQSPRWLPDEIVAALKALPRRKPRRAG